MKDQCEVLRLGPFFVVIDEMVVKRPPTWCVDSYSPDFYSPVNDNIGYTSK